jgi:hypothetical protein
VPSLAHTLLLHLAAKAPSGTAFGVCTRRFALTQALLRIDLSRPAVPSYLFLRSGSTEPASGFPKHFTFQSTKTFAPKERKLKMHKAIRLIVLKSKNLLLFMVLLALSSHAAAQTRAHQYLYTNNNDAFNSTTALEVSSSGTAKVINTYSTGSAGAGGGYFALVAIATAHVRSNFCLFVSNGGDSTIAAFTINRADGTLTTVSGSPFESGVVGAQQFGVGLTVGNNKLLFAGNTQFDSISELKISSTCALKAVRTITVGGAPVGLKVTPNGRFLIASYPAFSPPPPPQPSVTSPVSGLGQVDSFAIDYTTGVLTELRSIQWAGISGWCRHQLRQLAGVLW